MLLAQKCESNQCVQGTAAGRVTSRRGVDFSDCLMVEVARTAGHTPLGTFDRDLGEVDGAHRLTA
jgi:predicted nucleic acid-binding protein